MKGQKAEERVANSLRRAGASVELSPGSRGSADVIGLWPSGKKWLLQVKSSSKGQPAGLTQREQKNLTARADRNNATPVLVQVTPKKIEYTSAKDGRTLKP